MINLQQLETEIITAIKAKDQLKTDTLRGLKVRLQNEKIAKMTDLSDEQITSLAEIGN